MSIQSCRYVGLLQGWEYGTQRGAKIICNQPQSQIREKVGSDWIWVSSILEWAGIPLISESLKICERPAR